MRVTDRMTFEIAQQGQSKSLEQLATATRVASSGNRVSMPSDDPVAWSMKVSHDARIQRMRNRTQTVERAAGDLDQAESTLASAADVLAAARTLAVQAATGTVDAQSRSDMANQVNGMRQQLLGFANAQGASGFLFGGTATGTAPFNAAGAFVGNDTPANVDIADNVSIRANASGATAFTVAGGRDVLADLQSFATALSTNNLAGIQAAIDNLAQGHQQVTSSEVQTGIAAERFHNAGAVTSTALLSVQAARAQEVEADAPTAYSELSRAQSAFQQAITVTQKILQTTAVSRG